MLHIDLKDGHVLESSEAVRSFPYSDFPVTRICLTDAMDFIGFISSSRRIEYST